ncbi:hypothetical protein Nepgr_024222 [Nepenthes gracilis]|uniref:PHD-type zinc finger plants domain-containing protein n=1 Tax=Nepenthes gracilis TaxID=150966 RepID=A0AAD3XZU4_NEPGR|nr:hypothetical protein Nepgr_024222 [Nepenthes gracilis]
MANCQTVCCMCGDVGFPDKLFQCARCRYRFQHSYCSSYRDQSSEMRVVELCDWCQSEEGRTSSKHGGSSKETAVNKGSEMGSSDFAGERIREHDRVEEGGSSSGDKRRNPSGSSVPSPRPSTRRYKLLKDVMC